MPCLRLPALKLCLFSAFLTISAVPLAADEPQPIFNGRDFTGWTGTEGWAVEEGVLQVVGSGQDLWTEREYENFELQFEFNIAEGGNSGVFFRRGGLEVQLLDDTAEKHANLQDWQYSGSLYGFVAPSERVSKQPGEWQSMTLRLDGQQLKITLNGTVIVETDLDDHKQGDNPHTGLQPGPGRLGFQNYGGAGIKLRNIRLQVLD